MRVLKNLYRNYLIFQSGSHLQLNQKEELPFNPDEKILFHSFHGLLFFCFVALTGFEKIKRLMVLNSVLIFFTNYMYTSNNFCEGSQLHSIVFMYNNYDDFFDTFISLNLSRNKLKDSISFRFYTIQQLIKRNIK